MNHVIKTFEWSTLKAGKTYQGVRFTREHFKKLVAYHDTLQFPLYTLGNEKITFKQFVGVIRVDSLTIEILPKIANYSDTDTCRDLLLKMLRRSGLLNLKRARDVSLTLKNNSLLDIYIELFLEEVEGLIRTGLRKTYDRKRGQVLALKGRLLFSEQINHNLVRKDRFFTEHQTYNYNYQLNQILYETLLVLQNASINPVLLRRVKELLLLMPEVKRVTIVRSYFARIKYTRLNAHYEDAVKIAELFLFNMTPDFRAGKRDVLSILFDMNELFETLIFKELYRARVALGISVTAQKRMKFWESKELRPDIVITKDDETFIIDTKWKVLTDTNPHDNDLKQIFAYNHYFDSKHSLLLYPKVNDLERRNGTFRRPMHTSDGEVQHMCSLGFVDLSLLESGEIARTVVDLIKGEGL